MQVRVRGACTRANLTDKPRLSAARPGYHMESSCMGAIRSNFVDEKIERDVSVPEHRIQRPLLTSVGPHIPGLTARVLRDL